MDLLTRKPADTAAEAGLHAPAAGQRSDRLDRRVDPLGRVCFDGFHRGVLVDVATRHGETTLCYQPWAR